MNDNRRLKNLVLSVLPPVSKQDIKALRDEVDRCQNTCTCDGTVTGDVWNNAKEALRLLLALEGIRDEAQKLK